MAIYMAALLLFNDEDENIFEPHNQLMRITRRALRDISDPFSILENEFRKLYRLTNISRVLIEELIPFMPQKSRKSAISYELQRQDLTREELAKIFLLVCRKSH